MKNFLSSNESKYRLLRTIVQGVIAVLIANLDVLFGFFTISPELKAVIVAVIMAILSPIMAEIGKANNEEKTDERDK